MFPKCCSPETGFQNNWQNVCKMTSERLVHSIILFRAEGSCGVPGKTSLSGSRCSIDSKPQRLLRLSISSPIFFIPNPPLLQLCLFQSPAVVTRTFRLLHGLLPVLPFVPGRDPNLPAQGAWLLLIPCQSDPNWAAA